MIKISIIFGVAGLFANIVYANEWWKAISLLNIKIDFPEGLIVGFSIGGIASVIYTQLFRKKVEIKKDNNKKKKRLKLFYILSLLGILFYGSFYVLKLNSLFSTIIAFIVPTSIIFLKRKDLIKSSIISGFLMVIVALIAYNILEFLTSGWIQEFWYFKNVPGIILFNLPLDDIIWYFLAGMFISSLYKYWKDGKLIKYKK
ncbi:MAG: lycopene cyclase domain-containing protein [archaeon]|nr:lycopene cyclase domain-containing protein [archaeon]